MKSFLFVLGMLIGIQVHAAIGDTFEAQTTEGISLTYLITGENEVQVGNGNAIAVASSAAGVLTIPDAVVYNEVSYNVTGIGANAFMFGMRGSKLTQIILSCNLTSIGDKAYVKDVSGYKLYQCKV